MEEAKELELFPLRQLWLLRLDLVSLLKWNVLLTVFPCFVSTSEVAATVSKLSRDLLSKQQTFSHEPQLESPL